MTIQTDRRVGIILGCQWAYVELGWGGYWAWDPVENASFIPWLVSTAFIHTAIIQERRGIMKVWNMVLILLTFLLCIFGTYLVRSGVLQSVHDFGATGLGGYFLTFLGIATVGGVYLLAESYGEFTRRLAPKWPVLSLLEGGYDLEALAGGARAHVEALLDA